MKQFSSFENSLLPPSRLLLKTCLLLAFLLLMLVYQLLLLLSRLSCLSQKLSAAPIFILFGLPENKSLADTKSAVDDIFVFLTGRSIPLNYAFRLGRRKEKPELSSNSVPPRPLLVKLCNVWDKRLVLASKSKLSGYTVPKVLLREDLPLEVRKARALQWERRKAPLPRSNSNSSLSSSSSHADSHVDSSSPALGAQEDYHRDV